MSEETAPQTVPLSRLNTEISARKEAAARAKELAAEIELLKVQAGAAEELTAALAAERAGRAEDANRFGARESFVRIGLDPDEDADVMETIRGRYEKLPPKDRPALYDWLSDGAKSDRIASVLLPQPAPAPAAAAAEPEAPAASGPRPITTNAGTVAAPPAGPTMSRDDYQRKLAAAGSGAEVKAVMSEYFRD